MSSETLELWCLELAQRWRFRSHQQRNKTEILEYVNSPLARAEEEVSPVCQFHILALTPSETPSSRGPWPLKSWQVKLRRLLAKMEGVRNEPEQGRITSGA